MTRAEHDKRIEISNDLGIHALTRIQKVLEDQMGLCTTPYMQMRVMIFVAAKILEAVDDYFFKTLKSSMGEWFEDNEEKRYQILASAIYAMTQAEPPKSENARISVAAYLAAFCIKHPSDPDIRALAITVASLISGTEVASDLAEKLKARMKT
jgi:hypothetical protein